MKIFFPLFFLCYCQASQAQFTRYIIRIKDKAGSAFALSNPLAYLSQRAIDRRTNYSIAIDSSDIPVSPSYVTQIRNVPNVTLLNVSKWLNAVSIQTTDASAISTISNFPFVISISGLAARGINNDSSAHQNNKLELEEITSPPPAVQRTGDIQSDYFDYGNNSYNEIHLHHGEFLHNIGLRGQGMQIAILDGGFYHYTTLKSLDSINANGQVIGTWDFVNREASVVEDHPHGMQCLSTIAANIPGEFVGKAPKANFYLFRTEDVNSEYPIEEFNWVCGAERADSAGANIISTSLGYFDFDDASFNHVYNDMNGNTTMCAIGADLAAKKGLLVFASVGNEGNTAWHYLSTPSDGDSVLAVGAVTAGGIVGSFSSYGPSADGQVKPDMASIGVAALVQNTNNTVGTSNGTSFACPNMAGLGTCLWQGFPEFNNMKIARALQQSGNKSATPDDRVGYGIPDMKKAFGILLTEFATSSSTIDACNVQVSWTSKDISAMKYEIERKAPGDTFFIKIGEINPATGNILAAHSYKFNNTLNNVNPGIIAYRIRQVIDTSAVGFSAVYIDTTSITVAAGCPLTGSGKGPVTIQPNPVFENSATLVVETDYAISSMPVNIYDGKGSLVMQIISTKGTGKKIIDLPVNKLAKGKYYITVLNGQKKVGTAELIRL